MKECEALLRRTSTCASLGSTSWSAYSAEKGQVQESCAISRTRGRYTEHDCATLLQVHHACYSSPAPHGAQIGTNRNPHVTPANISRAAKVVTTH